jgi:hypothetical protein
MPGLLASQVKLRPWRTSETTQSAGGSLGWRTVAREPTLIGPLSRRSTLSMVGVHSDQWSTSDSTGQMVAGAASMCLMTWKKRCMYQTVHLLLGAGTGLFSRPPASRLIRCEGE